MGNSVRISAAIMAAIMTVTTICVGQTFADPETASAKVSNSIRIEEVEYDSEDREVNFDFIQNVRWRRNAKVTIYTMGGTKVSRYIREFDNDGVEVKVKRLRYGAKYRFKISGIKRRGAAKYRTLTGTFIAIDR